jgi:trk system potassium uptake protein TrkA
MVEMDVKEAWIGKTLIQLDLRKKYSMNVVAIRQGNAIVTDIDPQKPLEADMKLIVIANLKQLKKLK